jgi:hypothetical protein
MQVDSLFHSSMRKSRLIPNWSAQSSLKELTKYYLLNGYYVQKKNFSLFKRNKRANKDGDFCCRYTDARDFSIAKHMPKAKAPLCFAKSNSRSSAFGIGVHFTVAKHLFFDLNIIVQIFKKN